MRCGEMPIVFQIKYLLEKALEAADVYAEA
jgi:hypothetical protein